jgi:phosphoketolase
MITRTLRPKLLQQIDAWWRAANYLSVGQIYLFDNPLLKKPLTLAHIKPRLLGHWGTTSGLNFIYAHLNRVIKEQDLNVIYITGPGHGGPGLVATAYLEGTYSEVYPDIAQNADGMKRLFKQFSFREEFRVTSHQKPPARFTRAGNWAIRYPTLSARRSTIPTSSLPASLAMARRRPVHWPPVGTRTSS